jgi:7,8-dihydropterin-6-yl-methyl-4-(beta-D-ribofuranosyl)aminobenzene 5'-phosphate synthase
MNIKLIAEGFTAWQGFIRRWGISFLIGEDILFDTFGDPKVFLRNLRRMKIDGVKIRHIIISHDHWDHLAGLWPFLEKYKDATVYICPGFSSETKNRIASLGLRVVEAAGPLEIKKGIYTTGQIKGVYAGQDIYEQAVIIKITQGLAIVTGCAHPGIAVIVDEVKKHFGEPIFLIAGGFHLINAPKKVIDKIIRALKFIGVQKVVPMHCTGKRATKAMCEAFGQGFVRIREGKSLEV